MTIIINNVYAFQYPTKNRCTILVQPSFAKLVLLPIREAYEWKLFGNSHTASLCDLLPIREAYEWKLLPVGVVSPHIFLLPIREAYEWKRGCNQLGNLSADFLLPIREAYEWKQYHIQPIVPFQGIIGLASNS